VGTIAKGRIGSVLTSAEVGRAVLLSSERLGLEARARVGPIAERLIGGAPTGAEVILLTLGEGDGLWFVSGDDGKRFVHRD